MEKTIAKQLAEIFTPEGLLTIEKAAAFRGSILTREGVETLCAIPGKTFQDCVTIAEAFASNARKSIAQWGDVEGFVVETSRGEWFVTLLHALGASALDCDVAYIAWV